MRLMCISMSNYSESNKRLKGYPEFTVSHRKYVLDLSVKIYWSVTVGSHPEAYKKTQNKGVFSKVKCPIIKAQIK